MEFINQIIHIYVLFYSLLSICDAAIVVIGFLGGSLYLASIVIELVFGEIIKGD